MQKSLQNDVKQISSEKESESLHEDRPMDKKVWKTESDKQTAKAVMK